MKAAYVPCAKNAHICLCQKKLQINENFKCGDNCFCLADLRLVKFCCKVNLPRYPFHKNLAISVDLGLCHSGHFYLKYDFFHSANFAEASPVDFGYIAQRNYRGFCVYNRGAWNRWQKT